MSNEQKTVPISNEIVNKYLIRIKKQRELKESTIITHTEIAYIYDASRLTYLFMPSTLGTDLKDSETGLSYEYEIPLEESTKLDNTTLVMKKDVVEAEGVISFSAFEAIELNPNKKPPIYLSPNPNKSISTFVIQEVQQIDKINKEEPHETTKIKINGEAIDSIEDLLQKTNRG